MNIQYREKEEELISLLADDIARCAAERYAQGVPFRLALSGGETAKKYFPAIAAKLLQQHPEAAVLTELFQVDERFVPLTHPDSNWIAIRQLLADVLPGCRAYPMVTDDANIEASAWKYEQLLQSKLKDEDHLFHYTILGMGADAHFASLFPGSPLLDEEHRLTGHYTADGVKHSRITITLPVLRRTKQAGMYITGGAKTMVFAISMQSGKNADRPVSYLKGMNGLTIYTDALIQILDQ